MDGIILPNDANLPGLWLARAATIFFSLITLALVYRLASDLAGRAAGLTATVLYIAAPYLLFYERLVLIDTYVMTFGLLAIWAALRLRTRVRASDALLCGMALVGGLGAKGTGIVFAVIPLLAVAFLVPVRQWLTRSMLRWLALCYGIFALIWLPLYLLLRWRKIDYFGLAGTLSNTNAATDVIGRLVSNLGQTWQIDAIYFSTIGLLILLGLAIYWLLRQPRTAAYVLLCLVIPTVAIILLSPNVRSRYIVYHVPLLIIAASVGTQIARRWLEQRFTVLSVRSVSVLLLAGWLMLVFAPFYNTLVNDPAALVLPPADRGEYVSADSAGFALPELAAYFADRTSVQPAQVIGLLANCRSLRLYFAAAEQMTLECPLIAWDGSYQQQIAALVNQRASESTANLYLIVENLPYVSTTGITAVLQPLTTIARPDGNSRLTIYQLR
ncbi:MAG: glycosyltransferase family 39 protein [Anaerolineae bacterium]